MNDNSNLNQLQEVKDFISLRNYISENASGFRAKNKILQFQDEKLKILDIKLSNSFSNKNDKSELITIIHTIAKANDDLFN